MSDSIKTLLMSGESEITKDLFSQALNSFQSALAKSKIDQAFSSFLPRIYDNLSCTYEELGLIDQALENCILSYELKLELYGMDNENLIESLINMGRICYKKADLSSALGYFNSAFGICNKIWGKNKFHKHILSCNLNLGTIYSKLGKITLAEDSFNQALSQSLELNKKSDLNSDTADVYFHYGNFYIQICNLKSALSFHEKCLSIRGQLFGKNHSKYASSLQQLALIKQNEGFFEKSKENFENALSIRLKVFGRNHPVTATTLNLLGNVCEELGLLTEAYEHKKKALEIRQEILGEEHPDFAISLTHFANLLYKMSNKSTALDYLKKAITVLSKNYGNNSRALINPYISIATIYLEEKNFNETSNIMEILIRINSEFGIEFHIQTAQIYLLMGQLFQETERTDEAINMYKKALKIQLELLNNEHNNILETYILLGKALFAKNELDEASEIYDKIIYLTKKKKGEKSLDIAKFYLEYAEILLFNNSKFEMETNLINSYRIAVENINKNNDNNSFSINFITFLNNLGLMLDRTEFGDKALNIFNNANQIMNKNNQKTHLLNASILNNIALCMIKLKKDKIQAVNYLKQALEIRNLLEGGQDGESANINHNIGLIYKEENKLEESIKYLVKSLELRENLYEKNTEEISNEIELIADLYNKIQNFEMEKFYRQRLNYHN